MKVAHDEVDDQSWQWDSVLSPKIVRDEGRGIHYFVLFVSLWNSPDRLWAKIEKLTQHSKLGYRSSCSPDLMKWGRYEDHATFILDIPEDRKEKVLKTLKEYGLMEYVRYYKERTRYTLYGALQNGVVLEEF